MSMLGNGSSALIAFQRALSTVSHNIANSATEGYSRQRVELTNRTSVSVGRNYAGSGVQIDAVRRLTDNFLGPRLLDSKGEMGRLEMTNRLASRVDRLFSDSTTNIGAPWSAFFDAAQGVASQPGSSAARQEMIARAQALTARFDLLDAGLQQVDTEISAQLKSGAEEANRLAKQIANLNDELARTRTSPSPDLLDQRDRLISDLSKLVDVTTVPQDDGALNVFTKGGLSLVIGNRPSTLTTVTDEFRADRLNLALQTPSGLVTLGNGSIGGALGGALSMRAEVVDASRVELGRMATALAINSNAASASGMDLNGVRGTNFFNLPNPAVAASGQNTGTGNLTTSISNLAQINGSAFIMRFDGAAWSATRADSGQAVTMTGTGTGVDPFIVEGVSMVVTPGAVAGDRFRVDPVGESARGIDLAIRDPNRIAAASLIRPSADIANIGNGSVTSLTVVNSNNPALTNPAVINFLDSTTFTIDGGPPQPYTPGATITANGWSLVLDGTPSAGDVFRIGANVNGSSDNTNMRAWAALDGERSLDGGLRSMNDVMSQMTTRIGTVARDEQISMQAQTSIDDGIRAEREAVSGVNLDEEAANMLRYQQAYQAAAQIIATADTLFQTLLAAARR